MRNRSPKQWSGMRVLAAVVPISLLALLQVDCAWSQQGDWMYDVFVEECRKAHGRPLSTLDDFLSGEEFQCDEDGSGQSQGGAGGSCEIEAKEAVDWVFRDSGARGTYQRLLREALSSFDSVVGAQGHNPQAQEALRACEDWTRAYLVQLGAEEEGEAVGSRPLGSQDCRCISVLPSEDQDSQGRPIYNITNACDAMNVAVKFEGDILSLSAQPAFSAWARAGLLSSGQTRTVSAPAWKLVSIAAVDLRNAFSSYTCNF